MNKEQAINTFFSSFGLPAYEENSVPEGENSLPFPYLIYQGVTDSFGAPVFFTASIFYYSNSWTAINEKAREISKKISRGGVQIPCENGCIWIRPEKPFIQDLGDPASDMIKRKLFNLSAEFMTAD